jgi:hypothetical protein
MTGLVRFLAVEREIERCSRSTGLNLYSLVYEGAADPGFDPVSDIDADKTIYGRD